VKSVLASTLLTVACAIKSAAVSAAFSSFI
jgi:hypothetical protein